MIIVDTNVIVYLVLPGAWTADAMRVRQIDPDWAAPVLWRSEFRSVLSKYMRDGQFDLKAALTYMRAAERIMRRGGSHLVSSDLVLRLVAASACTAYDCEYVALAQRFGVPLVTSDKALLRGFPEIAMPLAGFGR